MKTCSTAGNRSGGQGGFTLVELMISILVLVILVVGGASALALTGGGIQRVQNKREAVVAANHLMESYWHLTYANLIPGTIETTIFVNGNSRPVSVSVSSGSDGDWGDFCAIGISVQYSQSESVELESRRYKFGLSKVVVP